MEIKALTSNQSRIAPEQIVDAHGLLMTVWPEDSRPSLSWLRKKTRARAFPYIKLGRRLWYRPSEVVKWLDNKYTVRPKTATSPECRQS